MNYNLEELGVDISEFSDDEMKTLYSILSELDNSGSSETYTDMMSQDYSEIPVDIITFLKDEKFLGKAWHSPDGKFKLYPYWQEKLQELFPDNISCKYNNAIFSGARGLGKSDIAITCILYTMYKVMCLKNPHAFFNLKPTEKIAFAFMNITKVLSEDIGISKFQSTVQMSPWFMGRGTLTRRDNEPYWNPPDYIDIIIGSQASHVIGQPILAAFFDEISFIRNQDIDKQKKIALDMIDTAIGGMKTRFLHNGYNPTLLILASSKRSEKSFLEEHMKKKLSDEESSVLIVDEAVWDIKPKETYCGKTFKVGVGNKFLASEILPDFADYIEWRNKGYQIIDVPIEFKDDFKDNIDRALCDFAGISSSELTKYISGPRLALCKQDTRKNLFVRDVIEVGNAPDDKTQYYDFIDLERIPSELKSRPMFVHLDMSISGDKTGIAGVWILGKKQMPDSDAREMYYELAFNVSIKAPKGYQVSFAKNREFIYWLKKNGFIIKGVSTDTYQNASLAQDLIAKGYNYEVISVDRVDTSKVCQPYAYLKNAIYEQRIRLYESPLLTEELLGLERNGNTGKIDHPDSGRFGCFTGDTKVSLVDGRELTFLELVDEFNANKINYVYSFNEEKKIIEPKKIVNAWCTKKDAELVKVTLDNGEVIRCTPNHLFMLRDGSYKEAQLLKKDDSLMPLYRKYTKTNLKNYRLYYEPIEDEWHYEHRKFATDILDERYLVHHKNCNPKDNTPSNLIWMSKASHQRIHALMETGAHSPEAERKRSTSLSEYYSLNKDNPIFIQRNLKISETLKSRIPVEERLLKETEASLRRERWEQAKLSADNRRKKKESHIKEIENTFDVSYEDLSLSERNSLGVKLSRINNPEIQQKISRAVSENHKLGKYKNSEIALAKSNQESKKLKELCPVVDRNKFKEIFGFEYDSLDSHHKPPYAVKYRKIVCKKILNHKVVSVEFIHDKEDVYDLTIEDNHNFALSSGVFVHNSKDAADALAGSLWNASQHAEEFAFEYGEDIENTIAASMSTTEMTRKQVEIDMQDILNNLHDPLTERQKQRNTNFLDFGFGAATDNYNPLYLYEGIIV